MKFGLFGGARARGGPGAEHYAHILSLIHI